jgi:hypothetical protein
MASRPFHAFVTVTMMTSVSRRQGLIRTETPAPKSGSRRSRTRCERFLHHALQKGTPLHETASTTKPSLGQGVTSTGGRHLFVFDDGLAGHAAPPSRDNLNVPTPAEARKFRAPPSSHAPRSARLAAVQGIAYGQPQAGAIAHALWKKWARNLRRMPTGTPGPLSVTRMRT